MARSSYTDETKAAVMASLMAGQSVSKVAEEYDIPRSTVGNWSAKLNKAGVPSVPDEKKEELGDRLLLLASKMIDAQIAMLEVMTEKDYLRKQDLSEIALALGIDNDKMDRMLTRFNAASDD